MSNYCKSCGVSIPDGQDICSMCYGDPAYGRDGYYEEYLRGIEEERLEREREEKSQHQEST